jgi:hypothetical protein
VVLLLELEHDHVADLRSNVGRGVEELASPSDNDLVNLGTS